MCARQACLCTAAPPAEQPTTLERRRHPATPPPSPASLPDSKDPCHIPPNVCTTDGRLTQLILPAAGLDCQGAMPQVREGCKRLRLSAAGWPHTQSLFLRDDKPHRQPPVLYAKRPDLFTWVCPPTIGAGFVQVAAHAGAVLQPAQHQRGAGGERGRTDAGARGGRSGRMCDLARRPRPEGCRHCRRPAARLHL